MKFMTLKYCLKKRKYSIIMSTILLSLKDTSVLSTILGYDSSLRK